jgi:hypothetical protein
MGYARQQPLKHSPNTCVTMSTNGKNTSHCTGKQQPTVQHLDNIQTPAQALANHAGGQLLRKPLHKGSQAGQYVH